MHKFNLFFETQWPRIREIQKYWIRAHSLKPDFPWFRKEYAARIDAHIISIHKHRSWMIKQKIGKNVQWVTNYIDRKGPFAEFDRGSGYRGEILQYIYWFEDDNK